MDNFKRIRTYGRKKSRKLSNTKQNMLSGVLREYHISVPELEIAPSELFNDNFENIVVEIGFGHGEHLISEASKRKNVGFIGCEPFENGIAHAVGKIKEFGLTNILIFPGDSRELLDYFADNSVSEFHIMFPDPWPKKRHHKRRLISIEFLSVVYKILKKDGHIRIASDRKDYISFVFQALMDYNALEVGKFIYNENSLHKPSHWSSTRYEQKALTKGDECQYLTVFK